jgi:hypothetical protein
MFAEKCSPHAQILRAIFAAVIMVLAAAIRA